MRPSGPSGSWSWGRSLRKASSSWVDGPWLVTLKVTFPLATVEVLVASAKSCSTTMTPAGAGAAVVELPSAEPATVLVVLAAWVEPELTAVLAALEQALTRRAIATNTDA